MKGNLKMKKHIFMVGLCDKDTKKQELSKEYFLSTIYETVGDCTISDSYGYYTHADGTMVKEPSLRVEMLFKNDKDIPVFASKLKKELNQESIGYDAVESNSVLL